jgi:DNA-binding GntR family transcriptional regulator
MGTATDEAARAARDAKLDALHERLTGAVEALVFGDDWRRALEFAARFRARSFNYTGVALLTGASERDRPLRHTSQGIG